LPDVIGTVTNATSSPAALAARKEIAELGEFVTNSAAAAPAFEQGKNEVHLNVWILRINSRHTRIHEGRL
jgi:hypothetical protein